MAIRSAQEIEEQLRTRFSPLFLQVIDESSAHAGHVGSNAQGFGSHLRVRIAAAELVGLGRLEQHRLVYDALRSDLQAGLHALAIEVLALHQSNCG